MHVGELCQEVPLLGGQDCLQVDDEVYAKRANNLNLIVSKLIFKCCICTNYLALGKLMKI